MLPVQTRILARRGCPRKILLHSPYHHRRPCFAVGPVAASLPDRIEKRLSIVIKELESRRIGCSERAIIVSSRPPGGPYHRNRPIAQAVDLVQTARFIAAGHQKNIRHPLRSGAPAHRRIRIFTETLSGNSATAASRKELLPTWFAIPQRHQIDIVLEQFRRGQSAIRSKPFCAVNREMIPSSGRFDRSLRQTHFAQQVPACRSVCRARSADE